MWSSHIFGVAFRILTIWIPTGLLVHFVENSFIGAGLLLGAIFLHHSWEKGQEGNSSFLISNSNLAAALFGASIYILGPLTAGITMYLLQ